MVMKNYLFVDLDDTLFQSAAKSPTGETLHPVAYHRDGRELGFMTERQRAVFKLLSRTMTLIPVTARDLEAFKRITVPVRNYAVIDYGAVILTPDGDPDSPWLARSQEVARESRPWLCELQREIQSFIEQNRLRAMCRLVGDFGMDCYLVAKYRDGQSEALVRIADEIVRPWQLGSSRLAHVHVNGNNLSVVPRGFDKAPAVEHLVERLSADGDPIVTWAMGDSLSDARFMSVCHYAIIPGNTQLAIRAIGGL